MQSLTLSMRSLKASASHLARWPQVHNCQSSYRQTGEGSQIASFSLNLCFWDNIQVEICVIKLDFQAAMSVYLVIAVMGGQLYFNRGHLHHTKEDSSVSLCCKLSHWWSNFGGSHPPTHLGIRTKTSSPRRWAILTNDSKLTVTVKVTMRMWITSTATMPNLAALPSDVWCWLTSPAWVRVSLPPQHNFANTCLISNTSV